MFLLNRLQFNPPKLLMHFVDAARFGSTRLDSVRLSSRPTSPHSSLVRHRDRHTKHEEPRTVISRHITMMMSCE
ncbi:hypothetical protein HanIR_Chr03g0142581 [Helianthus annuus]|nr:hypothetical protein HanIR_Chr03g0142581 [Helianthus annuus]